MMEYSVIGKRIERMDGSGKVTGRDLPFTYGAAVKDVGASNRCVPLEGG